MKKILMVLTNARRDCARLTLDMLVESGSLPVFDRVVFLLNGVRDAHMRFVDAFIRAHPETAFDKIIGPGTRPDGISQMQNECINKYPGALYMKVDEDVFVPNGWAHRMVEAYEAHRHLNQLALITPLLPNNAMGLHALCSLFYPDLLAEHRSRFGEDPSPERAGLTWRDPDVAEWATRAFLDLEAANARHRSIVAASRHPRYLPFSRPFSIGCIAYDYRHVERMGGIPRTDEPGWCDWVEKNGQTHILDCSQIALHYAFFVQQEWLDRSSLLEDIRAVNLPGTLSPLARHLNRRLRLAAQLPGIIRRRLADSARGP
ncbi:MAG TPA: hypothetical protein PKE12_00455 [Kiritimatiellia bacterium]|nr:hypothetical protein [Kiritimatiellia bacterium]